MMMMTKSQILTKFSCLNKGLECSSNLEKVVIRTVQTTFFNYNKYSGCIVVCYVLPHAIKPYIKNG